MKKLIALLLILCMLLPFASLAEGRDFAIDPDFTFEGGYTTITWTDSSDNSPYIVGYVCDVGGDVTQTPTLAGGAMETATTEEKTFTLSDLIAGHQYTVFVVDADEQETELTITLPMPEEFLDGKLRAASIKVETEPRRMNRETSVLGTVDRLEALTMMSTMDQYLYGLYYEMKLPELARERDYLVQIAFRAPNGYYATCFAKRNTFSTGTGWTSYLRMLGYDFFYYMLRDNESIPTGTYAIELYFDGMIVNTKEFGVH